MSKLRLIKVEPANQEELIAIYTVYLSAILKVSLFIINLHIIYLKYIFECHKAYMSQILFKKTDQIYRMLLLARKSNLWPLKWCTRLRRLNRFSVMESNSTTPLRRLTWPIGCVRSFDIELSLRVGPIKAEQYTERSPMKRVEYFETNWSMQTTSPGSTRFWRNFSPHTIEKKVGVVIWNLRKKIRNFAALYEFNSDFFHNSFRALKVAILVVFK